MCTLGLARPPLSWIRRIERLIREDRHVLRHVVPERNSEYSDVVGPAVPSPNNGVFPDLVSDPYARGEMLPIRVDVSVQPDAILARGEDLPGCETLECSFVLAVDVLRE